MTVAPMPGPVTSASSRLRRLTPMTSWVALTDLANSTSAARHVVADHLVEGAAERLDQGALLSECRGVRAAQAVLAGHVHGEQLAAGRTGGDPRTAAQQRLALGPAGEGDDDALAGLPRAVDALLGAVVPQRLVDFVGQPQQREFAQRGEVAQAEVVRQRGVDALGGVDEPAGEPVAQRLRGEVDDLDLVGLAQDRVGDASRAAERR